MNRTELNIAAVADIHCGRDSAGTLRPLFEQIPAQTDVLLLCGDLTDYGLPEEAEILMQELEPVRKIPILAVLGNHDYEASQVPALQAALEAKGVKVLDGHTFEMEGVGFVGLKGFGGGFGRRMLEPWGEPISKAFVEETVQESLKLERAMSKLSTRKKIVVLHYSPIVETVEGEPLEIYPFMGSSRLEEPINRYGAVAVFHGHAHRGAPEGKTREGIPVYNVAYKVLRDNYHDRPAFRMFSVPLDDNGDNSTQF